MISMLEQAAFWLLMVVLGGRGLVAMAEKSLEVYVVHRSRRP
jgi:hypothetical protein